MKYFFLSLILTIIYVDPTSAAVQTKNQLIVKTKRELDVKYLLYLPNDYAAQPEKKWPLIFFLHGAGERGDNLDLVKAHGPPKFVDQGKGKEFENVSPFIIVSPQCPKGTVWNDEVLISLLNQILKQYRADETRLYLTGLSMGGYGTWSLGLTHCDRFAAIAPICGGGDFIRAYNAGGVKGKALRTLGVWAFHGGKDLVVPLAESERMVAILKKFGHPNPKLSVDPKAGHNSWEKAYADPELYKWFLQHQRK
ncbi:MAG: phospholipase [Verrucomicrobia subdivision 3 bacterium]|nr:phospholipase [Limisphaerales bacterium]